MARLLAAWRDNKRPIIHVRHMSTEPQSTYRPGQEGNEFKREVLPLPGERIVEKRTNSAFIGTTLSIDLTALGTKTLVVVGVITNNSVEATVRMAGNLGYEAYVVADATATVDKVDYDGVLRPAEVVHAMALANMNDEYAQVVTTAEVLQAG